MRRRLLFLLLIILLSSLVRLVFLSSRPLGFTWDEAALGYNAYSLFLTGKDEYGQTLPLVLKSFGDYKPALYAYTAVAPIAALGLNEFSTRLPSVISGVLLVITIFVFASFLFGTRIGLFSALLLALTPQAIHFSRGAWEANLALLLLLLASCLFIRTKYLTSSVFFALSLYTYQGSKLFAPLLLSILLFQYHRRIKFSRLVLPGILGLIIIIPLLINFSHQSGRLNVFSVFSYPRSQDEITNFTRSENITTSSWTARIFHSTAAYYASSVSLRFLNHFSPRFLFVEGDWTNPRHSTPFQGHYLWPQLPLLLIGLGFLIRLRSRAFYLLFFWAVAAVLPAALSRDIVSAVRSLPLLIPLTIISAIGFAKICSSRLLCLLVSVSLAGFFILFCDLYFIHYPHYFAADWLYPYKPAMQIVKANISKYDKVIISPALGQPYIFWLFYAQINPSHTQSVLHLTENKFGDVGSVVTFDNLEFREFYWPAEQGNHKELLVGNIYELPRQDINRPYNHLLSDIIYPNGKEALRIVGNE